VVNQNAKREEIWLKVMRRYPSIAFVPVGGSVTGRVEANNYLYADDLVSGIEEAMSPTRLEKLWQIFSVNFYQRRKEGCKLIMIATRWSVHDPMSIIERQNEDNPRFKSIKIPCFDEEGESNFNFKGGFSTKYYEDQRNSMDEISFNSLYMQEPIEREGLLYHKEDLQYYFTLPDEQPESIIGICDSKNMGVDYVCSIVGYVYGDLIYLDDVVYNNGLPEITRPKVANLWSDHKVVRADVEMNNGGNYYAEDLQELLKEKGARTSVRTFYSSNNKMVKIITYSDYVKDHFIFRDPSTYGKHSEYAKFMKDVFGFTQTGKNKHDDSVDGLAMLAQLHQDLSGNSIKILDRRRLGI
jgi:predicted phage terminase large subunit-like protein